MNRPKISGSRISELRFNFKKLLKTLETLPLTLETPHGRDITLKTVQDAIGLLQQADQSGIINLDFLSDHQSWQAGEISFETDATTQSHKIRTEDGKVRLTSKNVASYFTDAVRHAINMSNAIVFEGTQQPVKAITHPYGQTNWQPAKLAA